MWDRVTDLDIEYIERCSECKQIPWVLKFDLHEYGHKGECSRS